jgi:hypothetical protein
VGEDDGDVVLNSKDGVHVRQIREETVMIEAEGRF